MSEETACFCDAGYQGIKKQHSRSYTPKKSSKLKPLTETDKAYNKMLSSYRIVIENIIRCAKVFRILAEKYRNRRKRFGLRFNLIAALYNRELDLKADL